MRLFGARLAPIVALVVIAGCAQLKEIREFAEQGAQLAAYTAIVDDDLQSFDRRGELTREDLRPSVAEEKEKRKALRERLLAMHGAIELYMQTIGQLAADKTVDYGAELKSLTGNLQKLGALDDAEVNAFNKVAGLIARAITDGYRQRELRHMIREAQPHLLVLLKSVRTFVEKDYAENTLALEANALRSFYTPIIGSARENKESAALELAQAMYAEKQKPIRQRQDNARAFVAVVDGIAAGHTVLYENADAIDTKLVLDTIREYAKQIKEARRLLRDLS
jgi:hypothetical protein